MPFSSGNQPEAGAPPPALAPEQHASVRDYIAELSGELSGLALSVGQARLADLLARAAEAARED